MAQNLAQNLGRNLGEALYVLAYLGANLGFAPLLILMLPRRVAAKRAEIRVHAARLPGNLRARRVTPRPHLSSRGSAPPLRISMTAHPSYWSRINGRLA